MTSGTLKKSLLASVGVLMFGAAHAQDVERVEEDEKQEVDNITVTGTNIKGVDPAAPTISLDREDFVEGGFQSLEDVFRSVPQNLNEIAPLPGDGTSRIAGSNTDSASGISLRGLGPQSTLTLFNGRRYPGAVNGRVFDISTIPLSVIERIDIVTGGTSAIYGSDAVAGVVNIIPKRSFDGVETSASYGFNEGGSENFSTSATFGVEQDGGGFIASYDYTENTRLDVVQAAPATGSPGGIEPKLGGFDLIPTASQHSIFVAAQYEPSDSVEVFADVLYANRRSTRLFGYNQPAAGFEFDATYDNDVEQIAGTGGVTVALPGDWTFDLIGTHGERETDFTLGLSINGGSFFTGSESVTVAKSTQVTALTQGTAFQFGGVDISTAAGFEFREQSYRRRADRPNRTIRSVFGEMQVPLVSDGRTPGLRRLEISAAVRYDDYSDVGHAINPHFGAIWQPFEDLTIRGTYARAFRAPDLATLVIASTGTQGFIRDINDPLSVNVSGTSPVFIMFGSDAELEPEEAETFTLGVDYIPSFFDNSEFSFSYFNIQYEKRIDQPAIGSDLVTFLSNEGNFDNLINRMPTEGEARDFYDHVTENGSSSPFFNETSTSFDPVTDDFLASFPTLILFNNQRQNIAIESVSGFDFSAGASFYTNIGEIRLGASGVYYLDYDRAITPSTPSISLLNEVGKVVDLKSTASLGWKKGAFKADAFVNHMAGYRNPLVTPIERISSWSTLDLTFQYLGDGSNSPRVLKEGFRGSVNFTNVFDKKPPFVNGTRLGLGYDPTNHNAFGRKITFQITKPW